jgi:hypothetical protein
MYSTALQIQGLSMNNYVYVACWFDRVMLCCAMFVGGEKRHGLLHVVLEL